MTHQYSSRTIVSTQQSALPVLVVPHRPGLIEPQHPLRKSVERFIHKRFYDMHGASISHFLPRLLAIFNSRGEVLAALGIRSATESLFLEYYLDRPIEEVIGLHPGAGGQAVDRNRLVEIGNLASADRGASLRLFQALAAYLIQERYDWATFTGGASLQRIFTQLGLDVFSLGVASQERLPEALRNWGSYYDDNPCIMAGRVSHGKRLINDHSQNREAAA